MKGTVVHTFSNVELELCLLHSNRDYNGLL
jgi:hypothetical protein